MKIKERFSALKQRAASVASTCRSRLCGIPAFRVCSRCWAAFQTNPFPAQVVFVLLYRLCLDFVYVWQLSPLYGYQGFITNIDGARYLLSFAALAVFAPFIARLQQDGQPSSVMVTLLNFLYFIPLTSYYACKGTSFSFFLTAIIYWAWLLLLQYQLPVLRFRQQTHETSKRIYRLLTAFSCVFILFISGKYTGFRFTLNFIDVYGIRAEAAEYSIPALFSYMLSMMTVLLSTLIIYWLQEKRFVGSLALIVVYLLYYSISAQKGIFLLLLLLLGCMFFYRNWMYQLFSPLLSLCILCLGVLSQYGIVYPMALLLNRMMYLPVHISEAYAEFFSQNPLNLFRDGIMGKFFFSSIYSIKIPRIIGEYEGMPLCNENNGLLGDLYANLPPLLGIFLLPLILIICFRLLDMAADRLPAKILFPFCVCFSMSFINGSWSTILLSNGFLLACVLLYLFPRKERVLSQ